MTKIHYTNGLAFSNDRTKIALILKNRPNWQAGKYNGIGGKVENFDVELTAAVSREFYEETGVFIGPPHWQWKLSLDFPDAVVHFMVTVSDEIFNCKSVTDEQVAVFDVKQLPNNVISNLNWIIPMVLDTSIKLQPTIKCG